MKKIFLILLVMVMSIQMFSANVYVYKNNDYTKTEMPENCGSVVKIMEHLGYKPSQYYGYFNGKDSNIFTVIFKTFTDTPICVISFNELLNPKKDIDANNIAFDYSKEQSIEKIMTNLENNLDDGGLTLEFMCDVLGLNYEQYKNSNKLTDIKHNLVYVFDNGIMTSFKSVDGYSKYVKKYKESNPKDFNKWITYLHQYYTNEQDCIDELNTQLDCAYKMSTKYIQYIKMDNGLNNWYFGYVLTDGIKISIEEFKKYSHDNAELISFHNSNNGLYEIYKYLGLLFEFENGKLTGISN